MVLYLLSCWCLWFLCLCQAKSELQVEFYVSDIQEVGDGFAVATLAAVRRRHLRAAWPRVAEASPSLSVCLPLSLLPSFLALISAFHTNNHPDTCLSRRSFSRWNVLTFNLLCPAGNLSQTRPDFFHSESQLDAADAYFRRLGFFLGLFFFPRDEEKTCGGGSGTVFNQGVSSLQVVKDTVNIQIGDVNDNAPTFHGQPYTVHIPEVSNQSINFYL